VGRRLSSFRLCGCGEREVGGRRMGRMGFVRCFPVCPRVGGRGVCGLFVPVWITVFVLMDVFDEQVVHLDV
jgi:hypothetical protein